MMNAGVVLIMGLCIGLMQAVKSQNMEVGLEINERGTVFTETIKIARNAVTFHVPAHNDVEQSDVLIDYKQRLSITRIPRLKECRIERMSESESSPMQLLMDIAKLKLVHKGKPEKIRTTVRNLIKTGTMKTHIPPVANFCGSFPVYKMEVIEVFDSTGKPEGHRIQKRRTRYLEKMRTYFDNLVSKKRVNSDLLEDVTIYSDVSKVHCNKLEDYELDGCNTTSTEEWNLTAVSTTNTCAYKVKCRTTQKDRESQNLVDCVEYHIRDQEICYELPCKKKKPKIIPYSGLPYSGLPHSRCGWDYGGMWCGGHIWG